MKLPYYIEPESQPGFAFAGLWDQWKRGDRIIQSCTIVTAAAPDSMKGIHHRIPVHLTREQIDLWVNTESTASDLKELLYPDIRYPLCITPVSTHVNNARNKDDRCIEPIADRLLIH